MTQRLYFTFRSIGIFILLMSSALSFAQDEASAPPFKNLVSTNLMLPIFESVDLSYERTIANKWAIGVAAAIYGDRADELSIDDDFYNDYVTQFEVMPFARVYFQGAQKKSHFVELFGSISKVSDSGGFVRNTTDDGFGVYQRGVKEYTAGGLGAGYGYRFLFFENRFLVEAQIGIRTNFDVNFIVLNGALVRTGIKVGYRF